jgi:hypothetical protein
MKQLIFSLSAAALLTAALFSCNKTIELNKHEGNLQKTTNLKNPTENENLAARIVIGRGRHLSTSMVLKKFVLEVTSVVPAQVLV